VDTVLTKKTGGRAWGWNRYRRALLGRMRLRTGSGSAKVVVAGRPHHVLPECRSRRQVPLASALCCLAEPARNPACTSSAGRVT
jgi:hypothetical protein